MENAKNICEIVKGVKLGLPGMVSWVESSWVESSWVLREDVLFVWYYMESTYGTVAMSLTTWQYIDKQNNYGKVRTE